MHAPGDAHGAPSTGAQPLPVLFLVHGSSLSAMPSFDLQVPGDEYSMMNVFARDGFDVWTMDHEGFGRSAQTSGTSDIASRVEDLKAAMATVQRETGRDRIHMFGESSGAIAAAAFAQAEPESRPAHSHGFHLQRRRRRRNRTTPPTRSPSRSPMRITVKAPHCG